MSRNLGKTSSAPKFFWLGRRCSTWSCCCSPRDRKLSHFYEGNTEHVTQRQQQQQHSYGVVFHTHRFAAFCELTAVIIEGKQLDHISWNVREVPFRRAQRVSLSRRYGESNQVVLHVSRGCYH